MLLLIFLAIILILVIYAIFGGPGLPEETDKIIEEAAKSDLSHVITGNTGYTQSDNVRIWFECISPAGAPKASILFCSGITADCFLWPPRFIKSFVDAGYQVIRFDQRSTGLSDWTWNIRKPFLLTDMAKDAISVLNELKIEKAHILGLSMGGMVAQEIGILFTERVSSLMLLSSTPNAMDLKLPGMKMRHLINVTIKRLPMVKYRVFGGEKNLAKERIAKEIEASGYKDLNIKELAELAIYDYRNRRGLNPKVMIHHMIAVIFTRSRYELLKKVFVPALVVHPISDPLFPLAHGEKLVQLLLDSEKLWINDTAHLFPFQNMEDVQSKIINWLYDR